ncbi:MAG: hypothetical protein JNM99_24730 [Verrucomicrobiaceae bacterium]|nr:hypothetical protein [Verrucomicrobiaceae bacterium]
MFLLDANVLIALGDPSHVHHRRVQQWFHSQPGRAWATCSLTENAFIRIISTASYPGHVGDVNQLRQVLAQMCSFPGHQFWKDSVSLRDKTVFPQLPPSKHLTDIYLLGLAVAHKGKLATLDRRIDPKRIPGGSQAYFLIP